VTSLSGPPLWLPTFCFALSRSFRVSFGSRVFRSLSELSIGKAGPAFISLYESVSQRPFDLVHSDVWGLTPFVSKGGHKLYIICIDDFSRYTWIYFMKYHSEALSIYKNFSAMIRTHFYTYVHVFHVDSAGEYLSDALCQMLAEHGTLAQFSYPGAYAQNGVAELRMGLLLVLL
jgi:transposase InsO family protein